MAFLPSDLVPGKARRECRAECEVCGPGSPTRAAGSDARFMTSSRRALDEGGWVTRQVCCPTQLCSLRRSFPRWTRELTCYSV